VIEMLRAFLGRKGRGYGALVLGFLLLAAGTLFHARLMETSPSLFLLLLLGGIVVLFFGVMSLFFEERILTQKAKVQERLLEFLMEYTPDHIYFKDRQSRFIGGSESLVRYFGLKRVEDLLGKTDFDFFSPPHAQEA
jgi:PAS domain-containing protein